ncbi:MAG: rRNA maturation RNase YbeY [Myxococcales bacterium]|nr:rRNA maturation RNase YbeY [Myxococcales bacterium]
MIGSSIHVNDAQDRSLPADLPERIRTAVHVTLTAGRVDGPAPETTEVSVTLVAAADMRDLNRRFHEVDAPTDVLAFGLKAAEGTPTPESAAPGLLGDIYVCPDVASESAAEHGERVEDEILRLAIHGTLHLLGHDHPEGEDRYDSEMFRVQERLLETLR